MSLVLVLRYGGLWSYLEVAKLIVSVPARPTSYQERPLSHGLASSVQDMLILGAIILLYILFLSFFLLPNSDPLPVMWRCGAGAREEIKEVGSVTWHSRKA